MSCGNASSRTQGQELQCSLVETPNGMFPCLRHCCSSPRLPVLPNDRPRPKSVLCPPSSIPTASRVSLWVFQLPVLRKASVFILFSWSQESQRAGQPIRGALLWLALSP